LHHHQTAFTFTAAQKSETHPLEHLLLSIIHGYTSRYCEMPGQGSPHYPQKIHGIGEEFLAGITKNASCYSLRHTFATYKAMQGINAFVLQEWLGHEHIATIQLYVHMGQINAHKLMENTGLRME